MFFDCLINIWKPTTNRPCQKPLPKKTSFCAAPSAVRGICRLIAAAFDSTLTPLTLSQEMLSHPKKTSSCSVSKSPLLVFLIDSLRSCAAHWHDIRDYEVGRATLSVLVVWRTNIRSCQRKGNKKVITIRQFSLLLSRRLKGTYILHDANLLPADLGLWYWIIQYCKLRHKRTQQSQNERCDRQGRLLSRQSSPHMQHTGVVGRDAMIITEEIQHKEPGPSSLIKNYWSNKKQQDKELAEINTTSI